MDKPAEVERKCARCNEVKPIAEFTRYVRKRPRPIMTSKCRACRNELKAEQREAPDWYLRRRAQEKGLPLGMLITLERRPCDVCGATVPSDYLDPKHNNPFFLPDTGALVGTVCKRCTKALGTLDEWFPAVIRLLTSAADFRPTSPERYGEPHTDEL